MPVTKFVWDPMNDSYLMETDETDSTVVVYTNEPEYFGNLVSQQRDSTASTYHFDVIGSVTALTNNSENVTNTYLFTAFGETVATTGTITNSFRYIGEKGYYYDVETDEYYVRARVYNSVISRWLSKDPNNFVDGTNVYSYAHNVPAAFVDPSGTLSFCQSYKSILDKSCGDLSTYTLGIIVDPTKVNKCPKKKLVWVQKLQFSCDISNCDDSNAGTYDGTIYEASEFTYKDPVKGRPHQLGDRYQSSCQNKTYGTWKVEGTMRIYCAEGPTGIKNVIKDWGKKPVFKDGKCSTSPETYE